jgi:hypothetical protein
MGRASPYRTRVWSLTLAKFLIFWDVEAEVALWRMRETAHSR